MKHGARAANFLPKGIWTVKKIMSIEVRVLKAAMLEENLSAADLAERCGVALGTFRNWICAGFPVVSSRYQVEAAVGYRPIWSSLEEIKQRRHCLEVFGLDPRLATVQQLRLLGPDIGADFSGCATLDQLIGEVFARAAITRSPIKNQQNNE